MSVSTYDSVPFTHDPYRAAPDRYRHFGYRRVGRSGLQLPPISLGFWYNFGDDRPFATQREIVRYAFDRGITHFDLANNYGPPYGAAEENFGRLMRKDLHPYRDELVISSKAGWDMWPGPYGQLGSRKYVLASLDASLQRLGFEYVDIFYSHRFDPGTPLEETIGALDTAVRQGKARYVGVSSYSAEHTREASSIAHRLGTPLIIRPRTGSSDGQVSRRHTRRTAGGSSPDVQHRHSYRGDAGAGEGTERDREGARPDPGADGARVGASRSARRLDPCGDLERVAAGGESGALDQPGFTAEELAKIDRYAVDSGIDLWRSSSDL